MFNTLMYPCFNSEVLVRTIVGESLDSCGNPIFKWLLFGRLPESPVVTPTSETQVIIPSAKNKFLESVVVEPIPTTPTP